MLAPATVTTFTPRGSKILQDSNEAAVEKALFRAPRTCYPGSCFNGKSRYDLPRRYKTYKELDEDTEQQLALSTLSTPRTAGLLGDLGRTMLLQGQGSMARQDAKVLPERPLMMPGQEDMHGVLVLGGKASGKTSLIVSLLSVATGSFPSKKKDAAVFEKMTSAMPLAGLSYELGHRDVRYPDNSLKPMRLTMIDTPAAGSNHPEEQPLCNIVSPNSLHHFNSLPSWMRMTMRSGCIPCYAVLFVVDATAPPLWEDTERCRQLARLLAVLKRSDFNVIIAVTKLMKARNLDREPRNCYETYSSRYLDKVTAAIQAKASEAGWAFSAPTPDAASFPQSNVTIFDAPTWQNNMDYRKWQETGATTAFSAVPNGRYFQTQLNKLLTALSIRHIAD
eukprot:TRINITY_DN90618_c0_g1_i1.p1 TRINITY_DN90618_c0_g1~~TRINITY_DN90618_c0_g1_i1.p1  ORF type:complete len:392 (-),score=80.37 TRINITY_DN90618_c0_g1_i1:46-1221(-)